MFFFSTSVLSERQKEHRLPLANIQESTRVLVNTELINV